MSVLEILGLGLGILILSLIFVFAVALVFVGVVSHLHETTMEDRASLIQGYEEYVREKYS